MAAPTIKAVVATASAATSGSFSPTMPTRAAGDLLLAFVGVANAASSTPTASPGTGGWETVGSISYATGTIRGYAAVWAKRCASPTETLVVNFSPYGTSSHGAARTMSITAGSWNDTGTLAEAWEDVTTNSSVAASVNLTGLVTTGADRLCLADLFQADNVATGLTNNGSYLTQGTDSDSSAGCDGYLGTRSKVQAVSGSAGATFTFTSGGTSAPCLGVAFALLPNANLPVDVNVPAATATTEAGGLAISASVPAPAAEATSSAGSLGLVIGVALAAASVSATAGGILITYQAPAGEPQIGAVTYPTATTWECTITNLQTGTNSFTVSDGTDSIPLDVIVGAQPHAIRAEFGASTAHATLYPGADCDAVSVTSSAGGIRISGSRALAAASVTASAGGVSVPTAVLSLAAASATSSAGLVGIYAPSTTGHVLRAVSNGAPVLATVVPGADGVAASVTSSAGSVSTSGVLSLPAASVEATAGGIITPLGMAGASVTTSAGSVSISATRTVPAASATTSAGGMALTFGAPAASATTSAGGASLSASVPAPAASATTSAGGIDLGYTAACPAASVDATAGDITITAAVPAPAATVTTAAGGISTGTEDNVPPTQIDIYDRTARVVLYDRTAKVSLYDRTARVVWYDRSDD